MSGKYHKPEYCEECAAPFPWISRRGYLFQLERLLDEAAIDDATRLQVREQLHVLRDPDLPEDEQQHPWTRVKKLAPSVWESGQQIIVNLASEAIRRSVGL